MKKYTCDECPTVKQGRRTPCMLETDDASEPWLCPFTDVYADWREVEEQ
jgi:hypothetical protein